MFVVYMIPAGLSLAVLKPIEQKAKQYDSTTVSYLSISKQTKNLPHETCKSLQINDSLTAHLRVIAKNADWPDKARIWACLSLYGSMPVRAIFLRTGINVRQVRRGVALLELEGWCERNLKTGNVALFTKPRIAEAAAARGTGHVYFVESSDGQFIKIGFSRNVAQRLTQLDTIQPKPFTVRPLGWIPGTLQTEHFLHEQFAEDRAEGEWFRKSERLVQFLETLNLTKPEISAVEQVA